MVRPNTKLRVFPPAPFSYCIIEIVVKTMGRSYIAYYTSFARMIGELNSPTVHQFCHGRIANKIEYRQYRLDRGEIPPAYDLRDFTSNDLIYGIKTIPIFEDIGKIDTEHYNLGRCLAYDYAIPTYKFFRFKNMYKVLCNLYSECNGETDNKHDCVKRTLHGIFNVLSNNSKYHENWHGSKCSYHFCIFIYGGVEYANNLTKLAKKFRERDAKEAQALSEYYNSRLAQTCDRIIESIEAREKGVDR